MNVLEIKKSTFYYKLKNKANIKIKKLNMKMKQLKLFRKIKVYLKNNK